MSSFQLEENIIGVPLFVPDGYNQFSIAAASMPNGDDALRIRGDISQDYKAFQRAQAVVPPMFSSKLYTGTLNSMSIVFWIKSSPVTIVGSGANTGIILSVMTSTAAPATNLSNAWMQASAVWSITAGATGTNQLGMSKVTANSGGGSSGGFSATPPNDVWTMITLNPSQAANGGLYMNDNIVATDTWSTTGDGTFPTTSVANAFLCIGPYANHANLQGRPGDYQLGKLSFHNHHLNATERSLLYNAMV